MQYMCLIYVPEELEAQPGTPEFSEMISGYQAFTETVQADGVFVAGDALQPVSTATTVTQTNGQTEIMDGPFAETKEQLGGYYLLECDSLDAALEYAAKIPATKLGRVEVRPIMTYE